MDTVVVLTVAGVLASVPCGIALYVTALFCRLVQAYRRHAGWYLSPVSAALTFGLGFGFLKAVDLIQGGNWGGPKVAVWASLVWLLAIGAAAGGFLGVLVVGAYQKRENNVRV